MNWASEFTTVMSLEVIICGNMSFVDCIFIVMATELKKDFAFHNVHSITV